MKSDELSYFNNELLFIMGTEIKRLRLKKNLTGNELGELIGLSQQQISRYERGTNSISMVKLIDILYVLDVEPVTFMISIFDKISYKQGNLFSKQFFHILT